MERQAANLSSPASAGVAENVFPEVPFPRPYERPLFTETFTLPGGYVDDDGVTHREVELAPVTGFEEELLDSVGPATGSAQVSTALLTKCLRRVGDLTPVTSPLVRDLLVSDREFLMLRLRELTLGKSFRAMLVCGDPKCAQSMDLALNLDDLKPEGSSVDRRVFNLEVLEGTGCFSIEFRLPTGADQEAGADWLKGDAEAAVTRLLTRIILRVNDNCSIDDQTVTALPAPVLEKLEQRIAELAPLLSIDLSAACVECGRTSLTHLDLISFFLDELQQSRRVLEREVHCIAWHYHWPEREILSLTRRKRRRYIELINSDIAFALYAGSTVAMLKGH
jgi:hypothetical protein